MINYDLGIAFFPNGDLVLIKKTKPDWQKGHMNGVGGKVDPGDGSLNVAMAREFQEETGVVTKPFGWNIFAVMRCLDVRVFCFVTRVHDDDKPRTTTEEEVYRVVTKYLDQYPHPLINNLEWLIPMARCFLNDPDSNQVPHTLDHPK